MTQTPGNLTQLQEDPSQYRLGLAGGRLARLSATLLGYQRWSADAIEVEGNYVAIPTGNGIECATTDNLIDSEGADAGPRCYRDGDD